MGIGNGISGCGVTTPGCSSELSDDDFTYGGVTYEITRFYVFNGFLFVELDKAFPSKSWVVHVGTSQFSLQDASFSQSDARAQWSNSGLNFATGASRTISLSLVEPPAPTHTLSVSATPPCGATVTDTSEHPRYTVTLAPAPHTEEKLQSRIVTDNTAELWLPHRSIQSSGKLSTARNPFSHFRNVSPGFRGFEFRLSSDRSVTAECLWTFREDPSPPDNQPPPDTDTDGSGNGGGGGPGPGGGGGGGPSPPTGGGEPPPGSDEEPSTSCPEEDREILGSFYEMTDGENWDEKEYWNSEEPLDQWHGVETDDGSVVSLRLSGNNLSGDIPSALVCFGELEELSELALWDNDGLSGEIPDEFIPAVERAALRDVAEALSLNTQWFEDYENSDFGNWHEGVTTDDDGRVTDLDFSGEEITGEIPKSVFQLSELEIIETGCGITLEAEAPEGVSVIMPDDCETEGSGDGGCALGSGNSSVFGLFFVTLLVFAVLGRRARD